MMTKDKVISIVRQTAEANDGEPLGQLRFFAETGLSRHALRRAGFPNYGAAREAAGYSRGSLKKAYSEDQAFPPLATLVRLYGRFPTEGEIEVAGFAGSEIPSLGAYRRIAKAGPLRNQLLRWCRGQLGYQDVTKILERDEASQTGPVPRARRGPKIVNGYVYLLRYGSTGKDYKVGCTENVTRREAQIDMMSPSDVRRVHVIETDDPKGIERYWMERFADRRVKNKEIFRLKSEDIAAFKSRKYQ